MTDAEFAERFWSRVEKSGSCWLWQGARLPSGYGRLRRQGKDIYAHRFAYTLVYGPIPAGMEIDHVRENGCTNTNCVNPDHLQAVTPRENKHRSNCPAGLNVRKTHCLRGHPLTPDNLAPSALAKGHRLCLICARERWRRYAQSRRARHSQHTA